MSDKCPKCGAGWDGYDHRWECGSTALVSPFVTKLDRQSDKCRIAELESKLSTEVSDWAETDTAVRNAARPVLGSWVDGDSDSTPAVEDIVNELVERLGVTKGGGS